MASAENDRFSNSQASSEDLHSASPTCMQKFRLYETRSMFYMVGRDKSRTYWRVLKIDRLDPSELNIREDSTIYTASECSDLLSRIHEGNKSTGGLNFITTCYGIVGFIKFLGPYYMLLITRRHQIGIICGHRVYAVSKSELIPLQNPGVQSSIADSKNENRYKRLLCTVDLTKDFFFSYSYHVMHSLQKNLCANETSHVLYETMFVWNEFLTRGIRTCLQNTSWTVALVYGFFKQASLTVSGRNFKLTLIARRSRHYAGTRYLKRGVNEEGKVANDVETEQIVFEDIPDSVPRQISSVVQYRGSIPLFWSQETSRLNMKPDIIVSNKDQNYEATILHFQNLVERYGNPIIILNLIKIDKMKDYKDRTIVANFGCTLGTSADIMKVGGYIKTKQKDEFRALAKHMCVLTNSLTTVEKKPRESILRTEFVNAIDFINKDCSVEHRLRFLHWDLHKHAQSKATNVLLFLGKVAAYALTLTGFFYYHTPYLGFECGAYGSFSGSDEDSILPYKRYSDHDEVDAANLGRKLDGGIVTNGNKSLKQPTIQRGVLRTNCIDCLDRTNVAQYAYGLAALGRQLHVLGVVESPKIDLDSPLANDLMGFYERMGDTLAQQYGGSAAHNKIFSERRGQWKAATQSQEFFRTLQRYYSNAYMDSEKQDAINIFLGNFRPQKDEPALWELDASKHTDAMRNGQLHLDEFGRSTINRSFSDGNFLFESSSPMSAANMRQENYHNFVSPDQSRLNKILSESSPEISTAERDASFSRCTPTIPCGQLFGDVQRVQCNENNHYFSEPGDANFSNFIDLDWLSSSGNSFGEESFDRTALLTSSSITGFSSENVANEIVGEPSPLTSEYGLSIKGREQTGAELSYGSPPNSNIDEEYSESFVQWVTSGETLCH